jgi:pre-mRNA-processing factor 6
MLLVLVEGAPFSILFSYHYSIQSQCIWVHHTVRYRSRSRRTFCRSNRVSIISVIVFLSDFLHREAQAKRGEEAEVDPDQFQDPDNEYGLFAGTTYEQDDEEADKIYEKVDENMDARRRARRCVLPG